MDNLDRIQQQQASDLDNQLGQAQHNADWANFFTSTPSSEVLRNNLNVSDLINQAVDAKQKLLAQSNESAQRLYLNQKRFDMEQELQPLKVQHQQAQIDHEAAMTAATGAGNIYKMGQDKLAANELQNMVHGIPDIQGKPGTPEHALASAVYFSQFPHALMTQAGKDVMDHHMTTHDQIAKMQSTRYFTGSDGAVYGFTSDGIVRNGHPVDEIPQGVNLGAVNRPLHIGDAMVDSQGKVIYEAPGKNTNEQSKVLRAFDNKIKGLGISRNDLANPDAWKTDVHTDAQGGKVPVRYLPGEKKTVTLPSSTFDALQKEYQAISSPEPVTTTVAAPTQAAPVIPADHAAFLRAHPEKAASFDQTYGAGTSAKILGQ